MLFGFLIWGHGQECGLQPLAAATFVYSLLLTQQCFGLLLPCTGQSQ